MLEGLGRRKSTDRCGPLWSAAVVGALVVSSGILGVSASATPVPVTPSAQVQQVAPAPSAASAAGAYGRLPLGFVAEHGRAGQSPRFTAHTSQGAVSLSPEGIRVTPDRVRATGAGSSADLLLGFVGASPHTVLKGGQRLPGTMNYLVGDRARWRTGLPTFAQVDYRRVWPGIDAVFEGRSGRLEYDFRVAPGADPAQIGLQVGGAQSVRVAHDGALVLRAANGGTVRQLAPHSYQMVDGQRRTVSSRYVVSGDRVRIGLGAYDHRLPLVIDPVLGYVTYLGGGDNDGATGIAVDAHGAAYVTGFAISGDFPIRGGLSDAGNGPGVFVSKLSPDGRSLEYSTYVGSAHSGGATGIAVDSHGAAYLTGVTYSSDVPSSGPACHAADQSGDAFVAKLSPDGRNLDYFTCLGGSADDTGQAIAVDAAGSAYVTGETSSPDFPIQNAAQPRIGGTSRYRDAFVTKLSPDGSTLDYSTYLGGKDSDSAQGIAIDTHGAAYVTGETYSTDFPTQHALQARHANGAKAFMIPDAFVTKVDPSGTTFAYSTFLGGSGADGAAAIAVDGHGAAYVTGNTSSSNFPTRDAVQQHRGDGDAFVSKLNPDGESLEYSTYLGSSTSGYGIAVDGHGVAYVTGSARSDDLPIDVPTHTAGRANPGGGGDAFLTRFAADGQSLTYSAFFGGSRQDTGYGIAVDSDGNAYLAGDTGSKDLPTHNAVQPAYGGGRSPLPSDAFVARLRLPPAPVPTGLVCDGKRTTIVGSEGDDIVHGTSGKDVVMARRGNDRVAGGDGADVVCLGHGDDTAWGNQGDDTIFGGPGADVVNGGKGADMLYGGHGDDRLAGGPGHDRLWGGPGRDALYGGTASDSCHPGTGRDSTHSC